MPATRARRRIRRIPTMSRTVVAAMLSDQRIIGASSRRSLRRRGCSSRLRSSAASSITLKTLAAGAVPPEAPPLIDHRKPDLPRPRLRVVLRCIDIRMPVRFRR